MSASRSRRFPDVLAAVERGEHELGVVPIENSIEGSVSITLDSLIFEHDLLIQREVDLPISMNLFAKPGTTLRDVTTVLSYPHAIAQCRKWLDRKLPNAEIVAANSTAEAAQRVSRSKRPGQAAIGNQLAARIYGLKRLAAEIEDHPENQTRFVVVGSGIPAPSGHDKTSIVCFQRADRPGSLLGILQEFSARSLNLNKLESRPTKQSLGDYCFLIDFEGHVADELVADCLRTLSAKQAHVKYLGSYPVAGLAAHARRTSAGKAWRDASRWVEELRTQVRRHVIDVKRLREEPEYRRGIERKRVRAGLLDEVLLADDVRRTLLKDVEELRTRQNVASKEIGQSAPDERPAKIAAASALKEELTALEPALTAAEATLRELALQVPNPADAVGPGRGRGRRRGRQGRRRPAGRPPPHDHASLAERFGWVDAERGAEASGSRFAYLMGEAVLLELALVQWVMGRLVQEGFTPVVPPVLVREHVMEEAGFFPTDRNQVYDLPDDELFLVGTSEVPLSALNRGALLAADALPIRYGGFSSNFRREAGTYGKDTRGIFRMHQFDKLEMYSIVAPDQSWDEHERILAIEESLIGALGLPYRVTNIAAGDLGAPAAKKYDIEVWLPSEGKYRELTSCSNYLDFSARRLKTRVRGDSGTELVHTLNGTACAISRTLVFLFEHYQQPDGSFAVPDVLVPHTGFSTVEARG